MDWEKSSRPLQKRKSGSFGRKVISYNFPQTSDIVLDSDSALRCATKEMLDSELAIHPSQVFKSLPLPTLILYLREEVL